MYWSTRLVYSRGWGNPSGPDLDVTLALSISVVIVQTLMF